MHGPFALVLTVVPLFAHAGDANRDLFDAARKGDSTEIVRALGQGADVNSLNSGTPIRLSPLIVAMGRNNLDAVIVLLEHGADPNLSSDNESPVFHATMSDTRILLALLEHGADPNLKTRLNYTPLGSAAGCRREIFLTLKKTGAYIG